MQMVLNMARNVSPHPEGLPQQAALESTVSSPYINNMSMLKNISCYAEVGTWSSSIYLHVPLTCLTEALGVNDEVTLALLMPSGYVILVSGKVYKLTKRAALIYITRREYRKLVDELRRLGHVLILGVRKQKTTT